MVYLDVFIRSLQQGSKIRFKPLPGQQVCEDYFVSWVQEHKRSNFTVGEEIKLPSIVSGKYPNSDLSFQ